MPTGPRFFIVEAGQRTGPHSLAVLKQKAEIHVLAADSLIAPENEPDTWSPLRDSQVLCEELLPARTHYALAPDRPVDHVNGSPTDAPPLSVEDMLRGNLARQRSADGELLAPLPPRPNRRRTDYLIMVTCGNLLALAAWLLLPANPMVLVPLLAFLVIYNIGLAWVLFGVLDRY